MERIVIRSVIIRLRIFFRFFSLSLTSLPLDLRAILNKFCVQQSLCVPVHFWRAPLLKWLFSNNSLLQYESRAISFKIRFLSLSIVFFVSKVKPFLLFDLGHDPDSWGLANAKRFFLSLSSSRQTNYDLFYHPLTHKLLFETQFASDSCFNLCPNKFFWILWKI